MNLRFFMFHLETWDLKHFSCSCSSQRINMSYTFRPLLLNAAIAVSLFCPFLQGRTTQELFFFSTRNSRYIPGSETEDILLDDKKSVTWCAVRCLGSPSCLAMDVCYLHTSTRCRMWSAPPGEDSTNKPNCRRFLVRLIDLTL